MEGRIKIITAFGNQSLQDHLRQKMPEVEFICEDLQYQEALLEVIKNGNPTDALILNMSLEGQSDSRALVQAIRKARKAINIIPVFKSTPDEDMQTWLEARGIHFVLIDNSFTIEDIYQSLMPQKKLLIMETTRSNPEKAIQGIENEHGSEATGTSIENCEKNANTHSAYCVESQTLDPLPSRKGILSRIYYSVIQGRHLSLEAVQNIQPKRTSFTIALFGSHTSVGCTHTAISIAWFLSMQNSSRIAVVELNESGAFQQLGRNIRHISDNCYELNGLHLYYNTPVSSLIKLRKYTHILIDCGCVCEKNEAGSITFIGSDVKNSQTSERLSEIERSDMKICVCQVKPWKGDETLFLSDSDFGREDAGNCLFYFTMTSEQTFSDIKKKFSKKNLYLAPYDPDIFSQHPERDRIFHNMLNGIP